jgi:hypothetical protein
MTITKLHIRFNLKSGDKNTKGLAPIRCRLTFKRQRKDFSTRLFIDANFWDPKKQGLLGDQISHRNIPPKTMEITVSFLANFKSLSCFHFSLTNTACKNKLYGATVVPTNQIIARIPFCGKQAVVLTTSKIAAIYNKMVTNKVEFDPIQITKNKEGYLRERLKQLKKKKQKTYC